MEIDDLLQLMRGTSLAQVRKLLADWKKNNPPKYAIIAQFYHKASALKP